MACLLAAAAARRPTRGWQPPTAHLQAGARTQTRRRNLMARLLAAAAARRPTRGWQPPTAHLQAGARTQTRRRNLMARLLAAAVVGSRRLPTSKPALELKLAGGISWCELVGSRRCAPTNTWPAAADRPPPSRRSNSNSQAESHGALVGSRRPPTSKPALELKLAGGIPWRSCWQPPTAHFQAGA
jgi:hypothetical protein